MQILQDKQDEEAVEPSAFGDDEDIQNLSEEEIEKLAAQETDLSFPYVTIAIGQTPEPDCPLCGGHGKLEKIAGIIPDTRHIPNKYTA